MSENRTMSASEMRATFNEWMRRYTDDPAKFQAEFQTVGEFLTELANGKEPSYGDHCTAYQFKLLDELKNISAA